MGRYCLRWWFQTHPENWGKMPISTHIFPLGLVQPPTCEKCVKSASRIRVVSLVEGMESQGMTTRCRQQGSCGPLCWRGNCESTIILLKGLFRMMDVVELFFCILPRDA